MRSGLLVWIRYVFELCTGNGQPDDSRWAHGKGRSRGDLPHRGLNQGDARWLVQESKVLLASAEV